MVPTKGWGGIASHEEPNSNNKFADYAELVAD